MKGKAVAIIGVGVVAIGGAAFYALTREQTPPGPPIPVTMAVAVHPISGLVAIALEENFFAQAGVVPNIKIFSSGAQSVAALQQGVVEMATAAETPIAFAAFDRPDIRILATIGSTDKEVKIVARKDRGINAPADLRGKHIATHQKGSSPHFFLHLFLTYNNLSEKTVDVSFNKPEAVVPALLEGRADAISMSEPYISQAMTGLGANGIIFVQPGLYNRTYNLASLESFVEKNPEAIQRVLRALVRAESFARSHQEEAIQDIVKYFEIDEANVRKVWPDQTLEVSLEQGLLTTLDDQARWALESGYVQGTKIPNYLDMLYLDGLKAVKPRAVTVISKE